MSGSEMTTAPDLIYANVNFANDYAQFRPRPPKELANCILEFFKQKPGPLNHCVDVGCGSGQNTAYYAHDFQRVTGVDVSEPQLQAARNGNEHQNLEFLKSAAESLPFEDKSVDLVNAASAIHWFDIQQFYKEVDRILRPGGVLAVFGFNFPGTYYFYDERILAEPMNKIVLRFCQYLPRGYDHCESDYETLPSLYEEDVQLNGTDGKFAAVIELNLDSVVSYINTLSPMQKLRDNEGEQSAEELIEQFKKEMKELMGTEDPKAKIRLEMHYFLRMWRKPN